MNDPRETIAAAVLVLVCSGFVFLAWVVLS